MFVVALAVAYTHLILFFSDSRNLISDLLRCSPRVRARDSFVLIDRGLIPLAVRSTMPQIVQFTRVNFEGSARNDVSTEDRLYLPHSRILVMANIVGVCCLLFNTMTNKLYSGA
jgi:hypothetical protein